MSSDISAKDFKLIRLIGKSSFSPTSIYLAQHRKSNKLHALRVTDLDFCQVHTFSYIQYDLWVSKAFNHKNVLVHDYAFIDARKLYVASEMMKYGSCMDLMQSKFKYGLNEVLIAYILKEVLKALVYIHRLGFIHRNIRSSHILMSEDGSVKISGNRNAVSCLNRDCRVSKVHDFPKHDTFLLPWLSPEILAQNMEGYDCQSDMYSLGISACELANGHAPFTDMPSTQMLLEKLNGTTPCLLDQTTVPPNEDVPVNESPENAEQQAVSRSRKFTAAFHKFVFSLLQRHPTSRPTATEALSNSFFEQCLDVRETDIRTMLHPLVPVTSLPQTEITEPDVEDLSRDLGEMEVTPVVQWDFELVE